MAIKTKLEDMEIGDMIACRYKAGGFFSELGTCVAPELPVAGSANPDGLFYFRKVDTGLCIADRVVQHSISWDTLNGLGLIQGKMHIDKVAGCSLYRRNNGVGLLDDVSFTDGVFKIIQQGTEWHGSMIALDYNSSLKFSDSDIITINYQDNATVFNADGGAGSHIQIVSDNNNSIRNPLYGFCDSPAYTHTNFCCDSVWHTREVVIDMKNKNVTNKVDGVVSAFTYQTFGQYESGSDKLYTIQFGIHSYSTRPIYQIRNLVIKKNGNVVFNVNDSATLLFLKSLTKSSNVLIRSLNGGNSYLNENEKSSLTDKGLGAFPTDNEWDTYIVKSNLNGTITAGDDNVWHWNIGTTNWCQDTPASNVLACNTGNDKSTPAWRTSRGFTSPYKINSLVGAVSATVHSNYGFRPVLEYIEPKSKATTLFY